MIPNCKIVVYNIREIKSIKIKDLVRNKIDLIDYLAFSVKSTSTTIKAEDIPNVSENKLPFLAKKLYKKNMR